MKEFWDARYREDGFAYGKEPNDFVKSCLDSIPASGKILFPAEGEGRNAVYAATQGWDVVAFDISEGGKEKAIQLAAEFNVSLEYQIGGFQDVHFDEPFQALVFSYVHVPASLKSVVFRKQLSFLAPKGLVIFEGFSTNNLPLRQQNPAIGGPDQLDMLYTPEEVSQLFEGVENLRVWEEEVTLNEGKYHCGTAVVIRATNI